MEQINTHDGKTTATTTTTIAAKLLSFQDSHENHSKEQRQTDGMEMSNNRERYTVEARLMSSITRQNNSNNHQESQTVLPVFAFHP